MAGWRCAAPVDRTRVNAHARSLPAGKARPRRCAAPCKSWWTTSSCRTCSSGGAWGARLHGHAAHAPWRWPAWLPPAPHPSANTRAAGWRTSSRPTATPRSPAGRCGPRCAAALWHVKKGWKPAACAGAPTCTPCAAAWVLTRRAACTCAQLAGKADASRVQQLEEQVDEQLNVMCAMRSKQVRGWMGAWLAGLVARAASLLHSRMCLDPLIIVRLARHAPPPPHPTAIPRATLTCSTASCAAGLSCCVSKWPRWRSSWA